jgi:hypothetical protein
MSNTLHRSLHTIPRAHRRPKADAAWMLNGGDVGLLRALDKLTASAASTTPMAGGASIAAHVDHVLYGLSLMNRWSRCEHDPWSTADWTVNWNRTVVRPGTDEGLRTDQ